MPKRTDLKSIVIIGAGPIVIGQACEFDYSGAQACKALREEGYRVILINSNPATIMTDPEMADATYIEPITPEVVTKILEKEKPDAILPTMGGQTALNTVLDLAEDGTLERLNIELIGANREAIAKAEDRQLFKDCVTELGLESPRSRVIKTLDTALTALDDIGLPAIIRPSFTLGGTGGGIAYNRDEFIDIVSYGIKASPASEVLIEESVLGWKEYEMEVVRDKSDNCIIICSIENIDPMGIHTGDSVTVAPALTLTDKEYQRMRNASIAVLRGIGVDTGGSNVQFALNPENGRMLVIEMNPRVSRSSALASKATGFPIAKIAAKLAIGYTLDELQNDITQVTPAAFEPTIDYVVTKIPRFAFDKFKGSEKKLTTAMKSVGEVMAIGRSFEESLQKALTSMETGLTGLNEINLLPKNEHEAPPHDELHPQHIMAALSQPRPDRLLVIAQAIRHGFSTQKIHDICKFDKWYIQRIEALVKCEQSLSQNGLPETAYDWLQLKQFGFTDERIAELCGKSTKYVKEQRLENNIYPVYKRIDTCAAEFPSQTPYMYSTYEGDGLNAGQCESKPTDRKKIIILGSGPNRIGQGIEFDYCCVHAAFALKEMGFETIMVNCNPETVSTDYDTADRLYFEPLTEEHMLNIIHKESQKGEIFGVIVQLGGQTPLKLCHALETHNIPILGTTADAIDLAEDRERFQQLLTDIGLRQPANGIARCEADALTIAKDIGYPIVIRPSYVIGGQAMEIVHNPIALKKYITTAVNISGNAPVLIDQYLQNCIEVDVDALADGADVHISGVMEHIEEAGIHSGDSTCSLPPHSLSENIVIELMDQTISLAKALNIVGLINVQFVVKPSRDPSDLDAYDIFVLEVNPRASRTVPFVAKATGVPLAKIASQLMAGRPLQDFRKLGLLKNKHPNYTAVKAPVFPFSKFPGVDVVLGPEMKSTGEVMGLADNFPAAFAKARIGAGSSLPTQGTVFISVKDCDKNAIIRTAARLEDMGFKIVATGGTAQSLVNAGIRAHKINKVHEGQPHVIDAMINGEIDLMINTTQGPQAIADSFNLRRAALQNIIPYYTTLPGAKAAVESIRQIRQTGSFEIGTIQEYVSAA